jgi:hypothetical protein
MNFDKCLHRANACAAVMISCFALLIFLNPPLAVSQTVTTEDGQKADTTSASHVQAAAGQTIPQDAKEFLVAAQKVNGLEGSGLKPWHVLVSYDKFDEDGDNVDSGTYEEWWVGPKQYRLTYTGPTFTQTAIASDKGLYRIGNSKWPGELQVRARDEFVRPMFREMDLQYGKPESKMRTFGNTQLPCVLIRSTEGMRIVSDTGVAGFCFEPNSLMLRYSRGGMSPITVWDQTVYDKIVRFQDRYIAKDIRITRGGKLYLQLDLEKLESITQITAADFAPPADAVPVDEKNISADPSVLLLDYLLHREMPQYPRTIRAPGGEATMKFTITKDGHVSGIQFVDGTAEMRKGLEESLKKYVYRPFLVRGEPVELQVQQKFIYTVQ